MKRIREAHRGAHVTLLTLPRFAELARASRCFDHVEPSGDLQGFGASGSVPDLYEHYGITPRRVVDEVRSRL